MFWLVGHKLKKHWQLSRVFFIFAFGRLYSTQTTMHCVDPLWPRLWFCQHLPGVCEWVESTCKYQNADKLRWNYRTKLDLCWQEAKQKVFVISDYFYQLRLHYIAWNLESCDCMVAKCSLKGSKFLGQFEKIKVFTLFIRVCSIQSCHSV